MSSMIRNIEKRILRDKGKLPPRPTAGKPKGTPYRHCYDLIFNEQGVLVNWKRYH